MILLGLRNFVTHTQGFTYSNWYLVRHWKGFLSLVTLQSFAASRSKACFSSGLVLLKCVSKKTSGKLKSRSNFFSKISVSCFRYVSVVIPKGWFKIFFSWFRNYILAALKFCVKKWTTNVNLPIDLLSSTWTDLKDQKLTTRTTFFQKFPNILVSMVRVLLKGRVNRSLYL